MRSGKKTEAETGKTRSCIVFVKNIKEAQDGPSPVGVTKSLRSRTAVAAELKSQPVRVLPKRAAADTSTQIATADKEKSEARRTTRRAETIAIERPATRSAITTPRRQPARAVTPTVSKAARTQKKPVNTTVGTQKAAKTIETPRKAAKTVEIPRKAANTVETPRKEAKTVEIPRKAANTVETPRKEAKTVETPRKVANTDEIPRKAANTIEIPPKAPITVEIPRKATNTVEIPRKTTANTAETPRKATTKATNVLSPKSVDDKKQTFERLAKRRNTAVITPTPTTPRLPSKRRATEVEDEPEPKMYKQSKAAAAAAAAAPPTIAASRSRRSIKPNPRYASEDILTPKYLASLTSDSPPKRGKQSLFPNDEGPDFLDDNDDELHDLAFNPQLHKSEDDDDLSEGEYEKELRREKVQVKRGRGRPPKNSNAAANTPNSRNIAVAQPKSATPSGRPGTNQPSHLQQLRRSITANMARSSLAASMTTPQATKRKLDAAVDSSTQRKRIATEGVKAAVVGNRPNTPSINGAASKAIAPAAKAEPTKPRPFMDGARMRAQPAIGTTAKQRQQAPSYKLGSPTTASAPAASGVSRIVRKPVAKPKVAETATKEGDDVPTFTIVNINDIINQDDVLITRSMTNVKKPSPDKSRSSSAGSPGSVSSPSYSTVHTFGAPSSVSSLSSSPGTRGKLGPNSKMMVVGQKPTTAAGAATTAAKPQPRILNTEMGKKTQSMKPLMSMGKELYRMSMDGDTEEDESDMVDDDAPDQSNDEDETVMELKASSPTPARSRRGPASKWQPRRNVLSLTPTNANTRPAAGQGRKLAKLLCDSSDENLFKKPASPSQQQRRSKENSLGLGQDEEAAEDEAPVDAHIKTTSTDMRSAVNSTSGSPKTQPKYFPPETTIYCEEDGRVVKKITCYETWHVISAPRELSSKIRMERTCLELPLVKLANVAARIKVPSQKWTSKVTLYKVSPALMQTQTMTIFTGDLKTYNIPEEDRHKYQPSCVLFRRSAVDRNKCSVPYDRAIIFKNKSFYANIDGKHVNLIGAPESVTCVKDVEILLDIVDGLTLSSSLVEMVTSK